MYYIWGDGKSTHREERWWGENTSSERGAHTYTVWKKETGGGRMKSVKGRRWRSIRRHCRRDLNPQRRLCHGEYVWNTEPCKSGKPLGTPSLWAWNSLSNSKTVYQIIHCVESNISWKWHDKLLTCSFHSPSIFQKNCLLCPIVRTCHYVANRHRWRK